MRQVHYILTLKLKFGYNLMHNSRGGPMAHDTARVSPRLHQAHENWEASHDFPRFSDAEVLVSIYLFSLRVPRLLS